VAVELPAEKALEEGGWAGGAVAVQNSLARLGRIVAL